MEEYFILKWWIICKMKSSVWSGFATQYIANPNIKINVSNNKRINKVLNLMTSNYFRELTEDFPKILYKFRHFKKIDII